MGAKQQTSGFTHCRRTFLNMPLVLQASVMLTPVLGGYYRNVQGLVEDWPESSMMALGFEQGWPQPSELLSLLRCSSGLAVTTRDIEDDCVTLQSTGLFKSGPVPSRPLHSDANLTCNCIMLNFLFFLSLGESSFSRGYSLAGSYFKCHAWTVEGVPPCLSGHRNTIVYYDVHVLTLLNVSAHVRFYGHPGLSASKGGWAIDCELPTVMAHASGHHSNIPESSCSPSQSFSLLKLIASGSCSKSLL